MVWVGIRRSAVVVLIAVVSGYQAGFVDELDTLRGALRRRV